MTELKVLISRDRITKRVAELGAEITRDFAGPPTKRPVAPPDRLTRTVKWFDDHLRGAKVEQRRRLPRGGASVVLSSLAGTGIRAA